VPRVALVIAGGVVALCLIGLLTAQLVILKQQKVEALGVLHQSLDIQRQTLQHAESIDRKTGGPAPPTLP
jgi:hypothetical protein